MTRKPFQTLRDRMPRENRERAEHRAGVILDEMRLEQLRKARDLTQKELADLMNTSQAQISKLERRADIYVSVLRACVEAMGGRLEIIAKFPDGEVCIAKFAEIEPKSIEKPPQLTSAEVERRILKARGTFELPGDLLGGEKHANFTPPSRVGDGPGAEYEPAT